VSGTWRIATWNLDHRRRNPRRRSPWKLIRDARADVVALQEVQGREIAIIRREHLGPSLFTQELYEPANLRWIGSGLLLIKGAEILEAGVFPQLPKPQRGIWARVGLPDGGEITAVSWHTPNAAGDGRRAKMAAYRAVSDWLVNAPHPLVLGADLNTWHDPLDLGMADKGDAYFDEHEFVGLQPRHGLVDAYRVVLERQGRLEALRAAAPPLAVSHVLSSGVGHRMDRIFVSADLVPIDGDYWHADAVEAGSDHALHWIELESHARSRTCSMIRAS
jgi:endonuclease/exonuclease/phosphatase family metal-dependent hydrolase